MLTTPTLSSSLLEGQTAIVTGGGNGIGRATCELLAANGARVVVVDLDGDLAHEVASDIGGGATAFAADLTDPEVPDRLIADVAAAGNGIDIIVNGAGYFWDAPVHAMSDEQFQAMLADTQDVGNRTPYFCSGCPHNSSTKVPEGSLAGAGIGCDNDFVFGELLGLSPAELLAHRESGAIETP